VALAVPPLPEDLPVRKYGALRCPDFPLSRLLRIAIRRLAIVKLNNII
jgi:hypothetical protein